MATEMYVRHISYHRLNIIARDNVRNGYEARFNF